MSSKITPARVGWATAFVLLSSLALTGCTINLGASEVDKGSGMMGGDGMGSSSSSSNSFSGADMMFAQMMIPHHQQAVDMGTLAETRAQSPAVKALAAKIKADQAPEIAQMKGWLVQSHASTDMGHEMGMGGMLSAEDMTQLKAAKGAEFDRLFLIGMIGHHQGAIHMAQIVVDSHNAEAKALGAAIINSQTLQIADMKALLSNKS